MKDRNGALIKRGSLIRTNPTNSVYMDGTDPYIYGMVTRINYPGKGYVEMIHITTKALADPNFIRYQTNWRNVEVISIELIDKIAEKKGESYELVKQVV